MRNSMRGVSLLELMIVVVIIGVMASIAYPSYRDYAARAKRNEARNGLLQIANLQERFYLQNNTYTTDMTNLGFALASDNHTDTGSYNIDVPQADANGFTAIGTYLNGDLEATRCLTFQIDGTGTRTSAPDADCWVKTR